MQKQVLCPVSIWFNSFLSKGLLKDLTEEDYKRFFITKTICNDTQCDGIKTIFDTDSNVAPMFTFLKMRPAFVVLKTSLSIWKPRQPHGDW